MAETISAEDAFKKLDKQLKCSLCLNNFKEPQLLPCYHVFCKSPCLDKLVTKDQKSLQCWTCRHLVPLPASGVSGFLSDFHIKHLFRIQDSFSHLCQCVEKQCDNCGESNATGYCYDCQHLVCDNCQAAHTMLDEMSIHNIATLDQLLTDTSPYTEKKSSEHQSYFHLDHLFEIQEVLGMIYKSLPKECDVCKKNKATRYCHECIKWLCGDCQATHKKVTTTATHKIITMDQFLTDKVNFLPSKTALPLCPKQPNEELLTYCETCCTLICFDCTVRLHRDHNFDLRRDVFDKHKEEIISGLRPVREKLDIIEQAMKVFDIRAKEINEQRVTVEGDIHKEFDYLHTVHNQHRLLDQQRIELVDKLDLLTQQKLKSLEAQRDQVIIVQLQLSSWLRYAEGGLETGTQKEVLAMKDTVLKRIEEVNAEFDPHTIQPETKADLRLLTVGKEQTAGQQFVEIISDSDSICQTV